MDYPSCVTAAETVIPVMRTHEVMGDRENALRLSRGESMKFYKKKGMQPDPPAVSNLAPALDIIRSRPYDVPHSEWTGLGRIMQVFLMNKILTTRGGAAYVQAFQTFPFPPGWARIQSPSAAKFRGDSWTLFSTTHISRGGERAGGALLRNKRNDRITRSPERK